MDSEQIILINIVQPPADQVQHTCCRGGGRRLTGSWIVTFGMLARLDALVPVNQ